MIDPSRAKAGDYNVRITLNDVKATFPAPSYYVKIKIIEPKNLAEFEAIDTNNDGVLTAAEIHQVAPLITVGEVLDFIKLVDKDGDNKLSIGEYEDPITQEYKDRYKEIAENQAFNDKDKDRNGKLDQYELMFMYPDIPP